ncbi:MAG: serine--tRNA ligase [Hymenobacteraceae bacterium]|nr:serine--tRNA ligase [Hymenobacteraceae bacterium]
MLQLALLRDQPDLVVAGLRKKFVADPETALAAIVAFDQRRRATQTNLDDNLARQNALAREIGPLMQQKRAAEAEDLKGEAAELKSAAAQLKASLDDVEAQLHNALVKLPNLPHASVPAGRTAADNEVVREVGTKPALPPNAQPHWDIIKRLDIIDFDLGNKITGAGFPVYKNQGARLQRALINFFLDEARAAGYDEIQPPILVNEASGYGTGQLPDKEGQMYHDAQDNLYLIPTAEVPITNLYRDEIIDVARLPIRNAGYTPCFRREAGSWGADVRGLNRLHQFDKVEIVQISAPETSYAILETMLAHVEGLLRKLELPYRVLRLCSGDMSFASALTYDLEVWSAAQARWLEVSSCSNFETFQANRLKLRYKNEAGKTHPLHTLNGSALALPRIVAALLENNQQADGNIRLPAVLHPYCGFATIAK